MKLLKLLTICLFIFISCTENVKIQVLEELSVINNNNNNIEFDIFQKILTDNEITILGEASHGDGKTFEVKSEMVKYLIENLGYNTIAFEGRDFLEMEVINGREDVDTLINYSKNENWVRDWSPWGSAQQIQTLVEITQTDENLKYIGLEPYKYSNIQHIIQYLKRALAEINSEIFDPQIWNKLQKIHLNLVYGKPDLISNDDYLFYLNYLDKNYNHLNLLNEVKKNNHILFLLQSIENLVTYVKVSQIQVFGSSEEDILNKTVNLRDKQMAENLRWYKKRNPNAKIIVWMANFHGAIDLKNITYADGDPERYKKFNVFGEHIFSTFGDKVFSIAFTSSKGKSKIPYDFEGIEEQIINPDDDSFENDLDRKNIDLAFINFREIRKEKPLLANTNFNSLMLGYVTQNGKWLNAFDGVFYIKNQEPAIPIE